MKSNTKNEKVRTKKKIPLGIIIGFVIFIMGLLIIILSFIINSKMNYNPYKTPKVKHPKTYADTFVVPDGAKYNRSYNVFNYKEGLTSYTYSEKMFSRHSLLDIHFKIEGGTVYNINDKTYFAAYFYNLSGTDSLNKTISLEFIHYNKTVADKVTYKIENLEPFACKYIQIEVDKKVMNAYDYKLSIN